jgi:hypothetical protein
MATSGIIPEDLKETVDSHMKKCSHKDPLKEAEELEELASRVVLVGLIPAHLACITWGRGRQLKGRCVTKRCVDGNLRCDLEIPHLDKERGGINWTMEEI